MPSTPGKDKYPRFFVWEMLMFTIVVVSAMTLLWLMINPNRDFWLVAAAGIVFTCSLLIVSRLLLDPESVRARQSDAMLRLASQTLDYMKEGITPEAALNICSLLLPSTAAAAIAITDKEKILGYKGLGEEDNPPGTLIHTKATHEVLTDGEMRVLTSAEEIGFTSDNSEAQSSKIQAGIVVPLIVGHNVAGVLKFYFTNAKQVNETQVSIAQGFGRLLSTQMAAMSMEEQEKLATSMRLKALQSQINPHFLFNTINTIASLIRTNPDKARTLLREFAVFYRRILEDSSDLILFAREIEQTKRYFAFEVARFGTDRVAMKTNIQPEVEEMLIPPFVIQPLVENAVRHAMPSEGLLTIEVDAYIDGEDVIVRISDDGVGMDEEARQNISSPKSTGGLGIAMRNVRERLLGNFGLGTHMEVESELGVGTTVTLVLKGRAADSI